MFEICCMVDDKKLVKFLKALDGLILGQPKIGIVRGAKPKDGKVVSSQPAPGTDLTSNVAKLIHDRDLTAVDADVLRELTKEAGGKPASYSYVAQRLRSKKLLGKPKGGAYPVLSNGAAH